MVKTRILSAILAALMLAGSLASCANETEPTDTDSTNETQAAVTEGETELTDSLPDDLDFGGDEITIISRYHEGWTSGEISVSGLIGEPVNDAVYERNKNVEQRLNVVINNMEVDTADFAEVPNKVRLVVQSGTGDYDIMAAPCLSALPATLEGLFVDLRGTAHIDFEKPWWSEGFNQVVEYNGAQYAATGDIVLSMYRFAFVTVFNQKLFTDANQPYLYEYVENGTWTLDKQAAIVPSFHVDNGNGQQDPDEDIYGLIVSNRISVDPYWSACDVSIMDKDDTGSYALTFDSSKLQDVMEKVLFLYYQTEDSTYVFPLRGLDDDQKDIRNSFAEGRGAMATLRIMELENATMRNMTDKYGVVPMPKFDQQQSSYQTYLHDQYTVLTVLTTVKEARRDEISATLEALASESYRLVRPVYYEATLRTKLAQDPQSAEMMDIVMNNIYIDAGIVYTLELDWFYDHIRLVVINNQNDVVSHYKAKSKIAQRSIRGINRKLDKIASQ